MCALCGRMVLALLFVILTFANVFAADDIVLQPLKKGKSDVALVLIQGAFIKPSQYVPLMNAIQKASEYTVWVGIPEYTLNVVEPLIIKGGIERVLKEMSDVGMKSDQVFLAGHSLGGVVLENYVQSYPDNIKGQILMGSFLSRANYNGSYPVPTLTIGGEKDGLCHVTRIMVSFYHQILHTKTPDTAIKDFPVIVIPGLSHMQFASGNPPLLVKDRDLKPEISYDDAHTALANITKAFISIQLAGSKTDLQFIDKVVNETKTFVQPLIKAYEMEGSTHFNPPCNNNPPGPTCTTGCPWSEEAQRIMSGLGNQVIDKDEFHPVYQIPVPLPKIKNNCSTYSKSCLLNTSSVSQCIYVEGDKLVDTSFFATSATEIRCKMSSRQAVMEAAGMKNIDFNTTDGGSLCKIINEASYEWALKNSGANSVARFMKLGEHMIFGKDKGPYNAGPLWIWNPLEYKHITNSAGRKVVEVSSPMMRTPTDFKIKLTAGFHYCKLLSPAKAMEWIYVDGLRMYDSLSNYTI